MGLAGNSYKYCQVNMQPVHSGSPGIGMGTIFEAKPRPEVGSILPLGIRLWLSRRLQPIADT